MSLSNLLEEAVGAHLLRSGAWAKPIALYLALLKSDPGEAGALDEVNGGGYARLASGPNDALWSLPVDGNKQFANAVDLTFAAPTADWGRVSHFALMDAATGGAMLAYAPLTVPREIYGNDPAPLFAAGDLKLTFAGHLSDFLAERIGTHLLRSGSWEKPTALAVGLETNTGAEVAGGGYSRLVAGPSDAAWTGPTEGNGQHTNATTLAWPSPTADWGTVATVVLWDAAAGGNALIAIPLAAVRPIVAGALAPNFQAGGISLTFD